VTEEPRPRTSISPLWRPVAIALVVALVVLASYSYIRVSDLEGTITSKNSAASSQSAVISELQHMLQNATREVDSLEVNLSASNATVASLQSRLTLLQSELNENNTTVTSLYNAIFSLQTELSTENATVLSLESQISSDNQTIAFLEAENTTLSNIVDLSYNSYFYDNSQLTIAAGSRFSKNLDINYSGYLLVNYATVPYTLASYDNISVCMEQIFDFDLTDTWCPTAGGAGAPVGGGTYFFGVIPNNDTASGQTTIILNNENLTSPEVVSLTIHYYW
jgi:hypothetical protein